MPQWWTPAWRFDVSFRYALRMDHADSVWQLGATAQHYCSAASQSYGRPDSAARPRSKITQIKAHLHAKYAFFIAALEGQYGLRDARVVRR